MPPLLSRDPVSPEARDSMARGLWVRAPDEHLMRSPREHNEGAQAETPGRYTVEPRFESFSDGGESAEVGRSGPSPVTASSSRLTPSAKTRTQCPFEAESG